MKKCWIQFAAVLCSLLILTCLLILVVDPLYYFHAPVAGTKAYFHNQVYQTAGAAEHFEYDSAIVGSSMTENFRASWFEEMGLDLIKLSYAGARSRDLRSILDSVYASGNDVKWILMDVNDFQITTDPAYTYLEKDDVVHGDGVLEGPEYLLNSDVISMAMGRVAEAVTGKQPDVDAAYTWEDPELFSAEIVKGQSRNTMDALEYQKQQGTLEPYDIELLREYCDGNLANVTPMFEAHPETEFVIFYPPYSILYWQEVIVQEQLEEMVEIYHRSIDQLLAYENVRVFYFQDEEEIITDLDSYRDVCHHTPEINRYIFDCIKNGDKEITRENLDEHLMNMYRIASEYPYEKIWEN